jgi:molybdopterin synthase catalytic subunit
MTPVLDVRVQLEDFAVGEEYQRLRERTGGDVGAVVSFVGLVRDRHAGAEVATLHLEHYPGMTEASMAAIVEEAARRWPLDDVLVIHRVGELAACDQIVFVQVASRHRAAAFAAAEYVMDYLKTDAVFWKREDRRAGSRWVEATSDDARRRQRWDSRS